MIEMLFQEHVALGEITFTITIYLNSFNIHRKKNCK